MSIRIQRVSEQVRAEIARLLREEVSDPRIGLLSITRVKVSPDFSTALVFWSPLDIDGETDLEQVAQGLESAGRFLRGRLGALLRLRRTPELSFRHDASIQEGTRILTVLRDLPETGRDSKEPVDSAGGEGGHGEKA
ncbi:MAG: 30S ribosome-binding factor RbfA [Myxococcota bacterium]|nr:30S ribosome-binding factor RbfA [Myxococcota bacterium]